MKPDITTIRGRTVKAYFSNNGKVATVLADKNQCPICDSLDSGQCGPCNNIRFCRKCGIKFVFPSKHGGCNNE